MGYPVAGKNGFLKVSPGLTDVNPEIILLHQEEELKKKI
jgi:hypothetical protein